MLNTLSDQNEKTTISIGSDPIDKALVGGLPLGSLTLIEGSSGTGKSVVIQHFTFGALMREMGVAYYVSGTDEQGLIAKMNSLYLEIESFIGEGQLLIYPLTDFYDGREDANASIHKLRKHIENLPWDINVVIVDSLTNLVNQTGSTDSFNFFLGCKDICSWDKTMIFTLHSSSMDPELLTRLDRLFDTHLGLRIEGLSMGIRMTSMNVIDVVKVKNANLHNMTSIYFEIDPELGRSMNMSLKVLPFFKVKT